jgi:AcrR family transcriptional regulator
MFSERVQSRADQAAATRAKVLGAAESRFRTDGFEATTIRRIAEEAGVSVGTVMAVGDKDALLLAVLDGWIESVHRARAAEERVASGALTLDILMLFAPFVERFSSDRDLARHYASIIVRGSHETPIFHELGQSLVDEVSALLLTAGFTDVQAERRARTIYLSYLGLLMRASNGAIDDDQAAAQLAEVIDLVASTEGAPA